VPSLASVGSWRRAHGPPCPAPRLAEPAARGHAAHGLTRGQADHLARQLTAAGFRQVRSYTAKAGHRTLVIIRGVKDRSTAVRAGLPFVFVPD